MKLIALELKNYRKYYDEEILFPDGLVGIIGPNGAGKSTLMEAVAWALYGHPAARTQKDEIKRQGSSKNDVCQVVLRLELGGADYQVTRLIRGKDLSTDASVFVNKQQVARGAQATLDYATKTLGMDREAFFTSFFAKQTELNALSDLTPAERKNLIIRMLGIDDIDKAITLVRQDSQQISANIAALKAHLPQADLLEIELMTKRAELAKIQEPLAEKIREEKIWEQKAEKSKTAFRQEQEKRDQYNQLRQAFIATQGDFTNAQSNLAQEVQEREKLLKLKEKLEILEPTLAKYEKIKEELGILEGLKNEQKLIQEFEQRMMTFKKIENENQQRAKQLEEKIIELSETPEAILKIQRQIDERQSQLDVVKSKRQKLEAEIELFKKECQECCSQRNKIELLGPESRCPTCFRKLGSDFPSIKDHLEKEIDQRSQNIDQLAQTVDQNLRLEEELCRELKTLKEKQKILQEQKSKLEVKRKELGLLQKSISQSKSESQELERRLRQIQKIPYDAERHLSLNQQFEKLSANRDETLKIRATLERLPQVESNIVRVWEKIELAQNRLASIKSQGESLAFSQKQFEQVQKKYENARAKYHQIQLEGKDLKHNYEIINLSVENLQKETDNYKKQQKEIDRLTAKKQDLEGLQAIFGDFRKHLIGRIRPALSKKASELFQELTDGKYLEMELNEDYEVFINDRGEKFSIERFSGGEKDLANLSLRLAISQLMTESSGNDFGFIILDEIFGSQDYLRKSNIMRALNTLSNKFRQIFLITHVDDIKDSLEQIISVQEDESGQSHLRLQ